jgi:hypothetical protein
MSSNHRKTAAHQPPHWRFHPVANDTPFKICRCKDPWSFAVFQRQVGSGCDTRVDLEMGDLGVR